jgi:urate oxidase
MADATLREHQHGKSRVRLGRTWREQAGERGNGSGNAASFVKHHFVEWTVDTMLESDMAHAFLSSSNAGMTATDTQKNAVRLTVEERETKRTRERV